MTATVPRGRRGLRRAAACGTAFLAMTATILVLPVYAAPGPEPEPVATAAEEIPMGSVADPAPGADVETGTSEPVGGVPEAAPALTVSETGTSGFSLVGVTWAHDPAVSDTLVQIRVQDEDGAWGDWTQVAVEEAGQDAAGGTPLRGGTEPLWTGPSTGVEAELVTRSGARPTDVRLELIDPGASDADAALDDPEITDTAEAAAAMPPVYSRAQWGADESIRTWQPEYARTIRAATIHHTADSNGYTSAQVPGILRSIYRYHAVSRGWGDIGYNVIADKFGRLWEGRYGGLASTVIGAHASGFNSGTFGVSMLGNYETAVPSSLTISAVADIVAWKFALYGVNPGGRVSLTSGGGSSKYAAGQVVSLPTIFGHRDTGYTSCPGQHGYAALGQIRDLAARRMSAYGTPVVGNVEALSVTAQTVSVRGWAIDEKAPTRAVPVTVLVDGEPALELTADVPRPDVGRAHPEAGPNHGFSGSLTVPEGRHQVCVRLQAVSDASLPRTTCKELTAVHPDRLKEPIGNLEAVTVDGRRVLVRGWTYDRDTPTAVLNVHVYVDGQWGGSHSAGLARTDVERLHPEAGAEHGFDAPVKLGGPGTYSVCAYAINQNEGTINTPLGCRTVTSPPENWAPIGNLESAAVSGRQVSVSGWALDHDAPTTPLRVHVYADGQIVRAVTADRTRADVGRAYPGTGTTHGYLASAEMGAGGHEVCVFAINAGAGWLNPRLACRAVTVPAAAWNPFGTLESVAVSGSTATVRGWAIDADTWTDPIRVHLYVDGRYGGAVTASRPRADVGRVHTAAGPDHGYAGVLRLSRGSHQICAYAINTGDGTANPRLGCRTVTVR